MQTTRHHTDEHPLLAAVLGARELLVEQGETPTWSMDAASTERLVRESARLAAQVAELEARAIGHVETLDLPGAAGMRGTAQWLARRTTINQSTAHGKVRLAKAAASHEQTRTALARGEIHSEQAAVITHAVDLLDDDESVVSVEDKQRAEKHLLGEAVAHDAHTLTRLGTRLFEVLDPAGADEHEAEALERQEARARKRTAFRMRDEGGGVTRGSFTLPSAQASMLKKSLQALAAPKSVRGREGAGSYEHEKPSPAKLGAAFLEYIERYPAHQLPRIGGLAATVVATGDFEILLGKVKAARLDTGVKISHTEFLRLACEAGIIPAWMDTGTGKTLSLGRKQRFHQRHQRLAKLLETDTCEHPHCTTPAALCHLHHTVAWSAGGETDTRTAVVLCPFHHHRAHATGTTYPIRT